MLKIMPKLSKTFRNEVSHSAFHFVPDSSANQEALTTSQAQFWWSKSKWFIHIALSHLFTPWWEPEANGLPFTEILQTHHLLKVFYTLTKLKGHRTRDVRAQAERRRHFFCFPWATYREIISAWDCSVGFFWVHYVHSEIGTWLFIKHIHSFLNNAAFLKSTKNDLDSSTQSSLLTPDSVHSILWF